MCVIPTFFPGNDGVVLDFTDFNKTRLSALQVGRPTTQRRRRRRRQQSGKNIKIAFSVVLGGKSSIARFVVARVICLLCSEEERDILLQHTGRAYNPCYLKYEKEKSFIYYVAFGETLRNQRREKESPPETPQTLLCTAVVVSFLPSLCSSSCLAVV